jgi:hypothetical protein
MYAPPAKPALPPEAYALYSVLVHRLALLLPAPLGRRLVTTPLRLANHSPPSGWQRTVTSILSNILGTPGLSCRGRTLQGWFFLGAPNSVSFTYGYSRCPAWQGADATNSQQIKLTPMEASALAIKLRPCQVRDADKFARQTLCPLDLPTWRRDFQPQYTTSSPSRRPSATSMFRPSSAPK